MVALSTRVKVFIGVHFLCVISLFINNSALLPNRTLLNAPPLDQTKIVSNQLDSRSSEQGEDNGNDNQSLRMRLVKSDAELAELRLQLKHQVEVVHPNILSAAQSFRDTHTESVGGPLCVGSERIIIPVADKDHETALGAG